MRRVLASFFLLMLFLLIILPSILARSCSIPAPKQKPAVILEKTPIISPAGELVLKVFRHDLQAREEMPLEEYLVGVVAAEMPAAFAPEALKAQAVSARTYTVKQMFAFGGSGCSQNPGADICTDPEHCQAWAGEKDLLAKWAPEEAAQNYEKIRTAVRETAGQVLTYEEDYIEAVFHAHCGGHTENSEEVWSTALPYLRGKNCSFCAGSRWSQTEYIFTQEKFLQALGKHFPALPVAAAGEQLLQAAERSASGRIKSLRLAGETISGKEIRQALDLPSTRFFWTYHDQEIKFTVHGYGHGVGLCQYGAGGMAQAGKTYPEILQYYYTDVELVTIKAP
ncbi:MAG: stage II sporulation protein D [Firmicutes bacterium]|nr:stage II sporulation protein D [Bacillota bacterium]